MKIVHIDDDDRKIQSLGQKILINCVIKTEIELTEYLKTAANDPGIVILDVVAFGKLLKDDLIKIGEDLVDSWWKVIYWSNGVMADEVREDCWFEDRNNINGVTAIATAINSKEFDIALKRGVKLSENELVLSLLSLLLSVGWFWELEGNNSRNGLLKCIETPKLKGVNEFEQLLLNRLKEQILEKNDEFWVIPVVLYNSVRRFDKFIENQLDKIQKLNGPSLTSQASISGVERVLIFMADSEDLQVWNENLIRLRESLLL